MKKVLFSLALSLVCILSFSQERVNTETYLQFDKTTKALKKVMGYEGVGDKWISDKNRIYFGSLTKSQSFNKLTVKTLTYNDTLYYVLVRDCNESAPSDYIVSAGDVYKYVPGGGSIHSNLLFFFTSSEFEQIFHLDQKTKTIHSFKTYRQPVTSVGKSNLSNLPNFLIKKADKNMKKDFMNIRIADDGKMVRFLLPYQRDERWGKGYDIFSFCYFEMPLKDFYKWLQPVAPTELTIQ